MLPFLPDMEQDRFRADDNLTRSELTNDRLANGPCKQVPGKSGCIATSLTVHSLLWASLATARSCFPSIGNTNSFQFCLQIACYFLRRSLLNSNKLSKTMQFKCVKPACNGCVCASLFQSDDSKSVRAATPDRTMPSYQHNVNPIIMGLFTFQHCRSQNASGEDAVDWRVQVPDGEFRRAAKAPRKSASRTEALAGSDCVCATASARSDMSRR